VSDNPLARLLGRPPDPEYLAEQAQAIARPPGRSSAPATRWALLDTGAGRLALPLGALQEVVRPALRVHTLPNRSDPVLLGLVNLHGRLEPCVQLEPLLNVPPLLLDADNPDLSMVVWGHGKDRFVVPVRGSVAMQAISSDAVQPYAGPADTLVSGATGQGSSWTLLLEPAALARRLNESLL
jgi:chemotaxis signal transduction protein